MPHIDDGKISISLREMSDVILREISVHYGLLVYRSYLRRKYINDRRTLERKIAEIKSLQPSTSDYFRIIRKEYIDTISFKCFYCLCDPGGRSFDMVMVIVYDLYTGYIRPSILISLYFQDDSLLPLKVDVVNNVIGVCCTIPNTKKYTPRYERGQALQLEHSRLDNDHFSNVAVPNQGMRKLIEGSVHRIQNIPSGFQLEKSQRTKIARDAFLDFVLSYLEQIITIAFSAAEKKSLCIHDETCTLRNLLRDHGFTYFKDMSPYGDVERVHDRSFDAHFAHSQLGFVARYRKAVINGSLQVETFLLFENEELGGCIWEASEAGYHCKKMQKIRSEARTDLLLCMLLHVQSEPDI